MKWIFIFFILVLSNISQAQWSGAFWTKKSTRLAFTTTAQTISTTWLCSGITTVQTRDISNNVLNVSTALGISLTSTDDMAFYSDSGCTTKVDTITVSAGTSSQSFYYKGFKTGSLSISATAAGYLKAVQAQTISARIAYTWIGGTSSTWSTASNWQGGVVPSTSTTVYFDSSCTTNCSPTFPASNLTVGAFNISRLYPGTLVPNSTYTLTTSAWTQLGGTFQGLAAAVTHNGNFNVLGGSYRMTSGLTTISGSYIADAAATIDTNSGTVYLTSSASPTVTPGQTVFNHLRLGNSSGVYALSSAVPVSGTLSFESSWSNFRFSGELRASGDVVATNLGVALHASSILKIVGTAAQSISCASTATLPNVEIAKPSGTLTFGQYMNFAASLNYSSGTVDATTNSSMAKFLNTSTSTAIGASSALDLYGLNLSTGGGAGVTVTGTVNVLGPLQLPASAAGGSPLTGTINAKGNVTAWNGGLSGTGLIRIVGNTSQVISSADTISGSIPNLEISSTGGTVYFGQFVNFRGRTFQYNSGTVDSTTYGSEFFVGQTAGAISFTSGSISFNALTISAGSSNITLNDPMRVTGLLKFGTAWSPGNTILGTILASGDVQSLNYGAMSSASGLLKLVGTTSQTISTASTIPSLEIASTGGTVYFGANVNVKGPNIKYTSGVVDSTTNGSTVAYVYKAGTGTIDSGPIIFNNLTLDGSSSALTISGTAIVGGSLNLAGTYNPPNSLSGNLEARGNINVSSLGAKGTATILVSGTGNQTVTHSAGTFPSGNVTVNKASGSLVLGSAVSLTNTGQSMSVTAGTVSMSGYNLTIQSSLSLSSGTSVTKGGGTLTVNGSSVPSGAYGSGLINP